MDDIDRKNVLESRPFGKRLSASLPSILLFAILFYFSVGAGGFGLASTAPIWMRLPFFLFCGLTVLIGLHVALQLFPKSGTNESLLTATGRFVNWAFSLFCLGSAIVIIFLLVRFQASYTPGGVALYALIGFVLLIASLELPVKAIRRKLKR